MKIGLCNGCFDLYHEGHRYFLQEARKHCDYLIVAVNDDYSVNRLKGAGRPAWNLERRLRVLTGNPSVSAAIPFDGDSMRLILALWPNVVIRGGDQSDIAEIMGIEYIKIPRISGPSTTGILDGVYLEGVLDPQ